MRIVFGLGVAAMALASCSPPKELSVDGAYIRLGAVTGRPAAAYFTVHGGPTPATLISVTTDVAIKAEMHETMAKSGVTSMVPLARVEIPANTDVAFAPGGRHVMLFNMNPGIKPGAQAMLTFAFADGTRLLGNANVVAAGTPAGK
ncbi:copper chaperone PCu(A)C [Sphingomonas faeni]|uniref:copper chaperone PCu(A)C n=1 Tax=Sphingomonas faeni TaxID=185950 RepID=UPI0020C17178|nr:copper chaperone PCu(A)C [Sphingomonas faeni]MCK8456856.1 copper chaperone PCu(A)C [Sphingomonas faeni]